MRRLVAVCCLTFALAIHSARVKLGLRLQNILGACGIMSLSIVAVTGLLVLCGVISLSGGRKRPANFENMWEGTNLNANALVSGIFGVIWYMFMY